MTDRDTPDTESAPTAAEPQTTELPPTTSNAPELAWSIEADSESVEHAHRGSPLVWSILIALIVFIAGALIFLGTTFFSPQRSKTVESVSQPTTSAPKAASSAPMVTAKATPPPTVTVTAGPPAIEPTPVELSDTDRQFIAKLRSSGVEFPYSNPGYPIGKAHAVCDYEAAHQQPAPGVDKSAQGGKWVEEHTIWYGGNAVEFSSLAQAAYCPQYLDGEY